VVEIFYRTSVFLVRNTPYFSQETNRRLSVRDAENGLKAGPSTECEDGSEADFGASSNASEKRGGRPDEKNEGVADEEPGK